MALTRKLLKGMGLSDEQIDSIIDNHSEVVDGLKEQIKTYKEEADKLPELQKELAAAKTEIEDAKRDSYKVKYEALKEEYDSCKTEQEQKETHAAKETAYLDLLKKVGISDKRLNSVLKVSDVDAIELDGDGNIKNAAELEQGLRDEWSDFITTTEQKGADVANPPDNKGGGTMSKEDIMNIKDPVKRQDAIAQNIDLFTGKDD